MTTQKTPSTVKIEEARPPRALLDEVYTVFCKNGNEERIESLAIDIENVYGLTFPDFAHTFELNLCSLVLCKSCACEIVKIFSQPFADLGLFADRGSHVDREYYCLQCQVCGTDLQSRLVTFADDIIPKPFLSITTVAEAELFKLWWRWYEERDALKKDVLKTWFLERYLSALLLGNLDTPDWLLKIFRMEYFENLNVRESKNAHKKRIG